jgi:hypothetical protein
MSDTASISVSVLALQRWVMPLVAPMASNVFTRTRTSDKVGRQVFLLEIARTDRSGLVFKHSHRICALFLMSPAAARLMAVSNTQLVTCYIR